ncbi:MAG: DUF1848 domain-containing protein [Pseudomonadota bacterium]|nr:DUF1848 domain-containing protein [Pseudomonadota bacterium]
MIVSASYRTDIPAFHAAWFRARLADGEARVRSPYGGRDSVVSLRPGDVDGFVFWTRNAAPFREALREAGAIAPFMLSYTVTGYPGTLERGVPPVDHAVAEIARTVATYGPETVVWRYDPVVWSDLTPPDYHRAQVHRIADRLAGLVDEVVFSAVNLYAKSRRNLARHAPELDVHEPDEAAKRELLAGLGEIVLERGMRPRLCSQPDLLSGPLEPARCVDAERLARIGGAPFRARQKGNRPGCACAASRDIGAYDSCAHGCLYCYAVSDHTKVRY